MKRLILLVSFFFVVSTGINAYSQQGEINATLNRYSLTYGQSSKEYADCLLWAAMQSSIKGDDQQAVVFMDMSTAIFGQFGDGPFSGRDTISQILFLDLNSKIEYQAGRDFYSLKYAKDASNLKCSYFGRYDKVYLESLLDVSSMYAGRLNWKKSNEYHERAFSPYVDVIKNEFCASTESERERYWAKAYKYLSRTLDLAYEMANNHNAVSGPIAGAAYDAILLSKGILLNTGLELEKFVHSTGNEAAAMAYSERKMMCDAGAPVSILDSLDRRILSALKDGGTPFTIPNLSVGWRDVRDHLQPDDLAIEFFTSSSGGYAALLLKKGWDMPKVVKLKNVVKISGYKFSIDNAISSRDNEKRSLSAMDVTDLWAIGKSVWHDDIVKYFPANNNGKVYFSPDGLLLLAGIEYFPFVNPIKKNYGIKYYPVNELFDMYRLSSTRQLVIPEDSYAGHDAVVFGDVNYDMPLDGPAADEMTGLGKEDDSANSIGESVLYDEPWGRLLGTEDEVLGIVQAMNEGSSMDLKATPYLGDECTESCFRAMSGKRVKIMHIATHGFYDDNLETLQSTLSSSCLCLAGVNNRKPGTDGFNDGLISAKEISTLDLRGMSLVSLSACETALGSVSREGVYGLQRGFKMAGVQSIVMSLWKVDIDATKLLMTTFYQKMSTGMDIHSAFNEAIKCVRANPRWNAPYYWSSFILLDAN